MGFEPLENPLPNTLITPKDSEVETRKLLPPIQQNRGCGDYTEFTWHAPTGRFNVACTTILPPKGIAERRNIGDTRRYYYNYSWGPGALCGTSTTHKGAWTAAKIMGCSMIELITDPGVLKKAKAEFNEITGGGVGGSKWIAPLLTKEAIIPTKLRWPEWVINTYPTELNTEKRDWSIPY
jgi:aminobenzoyl-glutamate utilization protein B